MTLRKALLTPLLLPDPAVGGAYRTFESPSAFSIFLKRLVNPDRKADDGWKTVRFGGKCVPFKPYTFIPECRKSCIHRRSSPRIAGRTSALSRLAASGQRAGACCQTASCSCEGCHNAHVTDVSSKAPDPQVPGALQGAAGDASLSAGLRAGRRRQCGSGARRGSCAAAHQPARFGRPPSVRPELTSAGSVISAGPYQPARSSRPPALHA